MWFAASMLGAILAQSPQPVTADRPVQLEVAVRTYRADGTAGSSASSTVSRGSSGHIWLDGATCGMGAGTGGPESAPRGAEVWSASGSIVRHNGDEYLVELDVHRVGGPAGSITPARMVMLHLSQPTTIQEVPSATGRCNGQAVRIEAAVVLATDRTTASASGGGRGAASGGVGTGPRGTAGATTGVSGSGGSGGTRATGSGGVGSGSANAGPQSGWIFPPHDPLAGRGVFDATLNKFIGEPTEQSVLTTETSVASGTTSSEATPVELRPRRASLLAQMWFVIRTPDGVEHTQSTFGHVDDLGEIFRFSTFSAPKPGGARQLVLVGINLRPMSTPDGRPVLRAAIARILDNGGVGVSNRAIPMPGRDDVVSFEIPATGGEQDALAGYHLEIRVRVTPGG